MLLLLTVAEVAERLHCSTSLIYGLLKQGRLPYVRLGSGQGGKRICESDLEQFIVENKVVEQQIAPPVKVKLKHLQL